MMLENNISQIAKNIRLLILDVDGVLTNGKIYVTAEGVEIIQFHVHDGFGMRRLMQSGVELAVISSRNTKAVVSRLEYLGVKHVFLGQTEKLDGTQYNSIFDKIKKLKTGLLSSRQRRNEILKKIERVKELKGDEPVNVPKTQRIKAFPGTRTQLDPHWELWVGRNASQNDELIKMAAPEDLWIHLRDYAGAHGILKGPKKKEPPFEILEKACCIVAKLSQAKKNPFVQGQKLDFIVVPRKFVKKPKGAMPGRVNVEREKVRRVVYKTVEFEVS